MPANPLFIFDLDNTLYPREVRLWKMVDARIERYVSDTLGLDPLEARRVRKDFLKEFGTTLRGLMHHHGVSPGEYLEYVHDLPIPEIVPPRPELSAMLAALPGRCVVFTNGSGSYAGRVLDALGVSDRMNGIYGIEFMEYIAKPSPYPYAKLLRAEGARAEASLFCEDIRENLVPARELGMFTVWVGQRDGAAPVEGPDAVVHALLPDVCDLPTVLPGFLAQAGRNGRRWAAPQSGAPQSQEDRDDRTESEAQVLETGPPEEEGGGGVCRGRR